MISFAQIGDVHLGSPLMPVGELTSARRRSRLLLSFEEAIAEIAARGVALCFLPGDLFDSNQVTSATVQGAISALGKAKEVLFFIAPGNHDPAEPDSPYLCEAWPENVHIFKEETITRVELPQYRLCVYGRAGKRCASEEDALAGFSVEDPSKINVFLLHANLAGSPREDYSRVAPAQIAASGLDYLALGHVHRFGGLSRSGQTAYAYSGCLEGRGFDETGKKGFLLGTLEKGRVDAALVPWGRTCFEECSADITACGDQRDVLAAIAAARAAFSAEAVVRVRLTGSTGLELSPKALLEACCNVLELKSQVTEALDFQALAAEQSLTGFFLRALQKREAAASPEEREEIALARTLGLRALAGKKVLTHED